MRTFWHLSWNICKVRHRIGGNAQTWVRYPGATRQPDETEDNFAVLVVKGKIVLGVVLIQPGIYSPWPNTITIDLPALLDEVVITVTFKLKLVWIMFLSAIHREYSVKSWSWRTRWETWCIIKQTSSQLKALPFDLILMYLDPYK